MKIAIVVHGRFHAFDLARALVGHGHDVTVLTNYPRWAARRFGLAESAVRSFVTHGVVSRTVARFAPGPIDDRSERWLHASFGRWAAAELVRERWDVVHTWSGVSEETLRTPLPGAPFKLLMRGSAHIEVQDRLLAEEAVRVQGAVERPSRWMIDRELREYARADHIAVLSTFARRTFLERGVAPEKTSVLPLGVDVFAFRPPRDVCDARVERIRNGEPLTALYTGALSFQKGVADLIEMARRVENLPIRFRLVGTITEEVRPLLAALPPNVTCAPKVPQARLPGEYARADLFVFPTIQDGFGMVLAQANASGLPILTTPNSAGADLVREGVTGWVLPIRDPSAFAERLRWCASHREELSDLVQRSDALFEPRSWDQVAEDFVALCQQTAGTIHGR